MSGKTPQKNKQGMRTMKFKPINTKKEAYKKLTASLQKCEKTGAQYVTVSALNKCFGFVGHSADTTKNAVNALKVKVVKHGNVGYIAKDDAKKVIDFVFANKAK